MLLQIAYRYKSFDYLVYMKKARQLVGLKILNQSEINYSKD
jgi:hypothetical protein